MLELPLLLLGLWCNPVRWELNNNLLIYTKSQCWIGDNFLAIGQRTVESPRARCDLDKAVQLGEGRWNLNTEMAYNVWLKCRDAVTTWQQQVTMVENGWLRISSNSIAYAPGYIGPGRSLIRW